jgi:hypothetical protein
MALRKCAQAKMIGFNVTSNLMAADGLTIG